MPSGYPYCYLPLLSMTWTCPSCDTGCVLRVQLSPRSCDSGILWSWHHGYVRAPRSLAAYGILKCWCGQAPEILFCQIFLESSFLRVLQEWLRSQSPRFALGNWCHLEVTSASDWAGVCASLVPFGTQLCWVLKNFVFSTLIISVSDLQGSGLCPVSWELSSLCDPVILWSCMFQSTC